MLGWNKKTVLTWRGKLTVMRNVPVLKLGPSLHVVIAILAGTSFWTHFGSGGPQCGSPLAQDLRLIRTRTEKLSGETIEVGRLIQVISEDQ